MHRTAPTLIPAEPTLAHKCLAEGLGTYLLVLLGCGVVHTAVLTGAQSGIWQVAIVWGVAVMLAIYATAAISGAHLNPAITLAFAVWGRCSWHVVLPYLAAQLLGAFVAAATLFALFHPFLAAHEAEKQVVRGQSGSELTAMCYGEYFPNPGPIGGTPGPYSPQAHQDYNTRVSLPAAFLAELLGTLVLAAVIASVSDERNAGDPLRGFAPVFIGLTVAGLISFIGPLTQACFNPARDLGPRLFAALAGWGSIALPGPRGILGLSVYLLAPVLGAILGLGVSRSLLAPAHPVGTPIESPTSHMSPEEIAVS